MPVSTDPISADPGSLDSASTDPASTDPVSSSADVYRFDRCERPPEFELENLTGKSDAQQRAAHNVETKRYNAYIATVNVYLQCLSQQAESDIDAYYNKVSGALDAESASILGDVEAKRAALNRTR